MIIMRSGRGMGGAKSTQRHAQHLLGGGLADTAGYTHHTRHRTGTPGRTKRCQPRQRIANHQQLRCIHRALGGVIHHRRHGTARQRIGNEIMPITLVTQRDENIAWRNAAAVN